VRRSWVALLALSLLIGAATVGATAARAQLSGLPVVRGPEPLTESNGPLRWRLTALVQRIPAPLPSAPRRTEDLSCLVLRHAGSRETRCLDGEPRLWRSLDGATYELGASAGSARRRYLLWGFATRRAATVVVVLSRCRRPPFAASTGSRS
jgi:hypothetical protein